MRNKAAFTLVESLFVISIISMVLLFSFNHIPSGIHFLDDTSLISTIIYHCQSDSLVSKKKVNLSHYFNEINVGDYTFNSSGNINHGGTVKLMDKECVFQLGMGRFYVVP